MTATSSMLPDKPPPRVRHGWRCLAAGPYHEEARELSDVRVLTVTVCESCGGDDLEHQLRTDPEKLARARQPDNDGGSSRTTHFGFRTLPAYGSSTGA